MHGMPGVGVVGLVVKRVLAERDVADGEVKGVGLDRGVREGLAADRRVRVQAPGNRGCQRIKLHAGHPGTFRGETNERSRAGSGFQHLSPGEAEPVNGGPDFLYQGGVGVIRVRRGPRRSGILALAQDFLQLGALGHPFGLVKQLGHSSPAGPPRQGTLFFLAGRPLLVLQLPDDADCFNVCGEAGFLSRWGKVGLGCWAEPSGRGTRCRLLLRFCL